MSLESDKRLSLEELKKLHSTEMQKAANVDRSVTITEANWTALLRLQNLHLEQLAAQQQILNSLMKKQDAEEHLLKLKEHSKSAAIWVRQQSEQTLRDIRLEAKQYTEQVGRASERYCSGLEKAVADMEHRLREQTDLIGCRIDRLVEETQQKLKSLITIACGSVVLLTILSGLAILLRK